MPEYLVPVVGMLAAITSGTLGACFGVGVAWLLVRVEDRVRQWRERRSADA